MVPYIGVKKTSLYLEPELDRKLAARAADEGIPKAALIRRSLTAAVADVAPPRPDSAGVFDGPPDLSSDADRYLSETGFGHS